MLSASKSLILNIKYRTLNIKSCLLSLLLLLVAGAVEARPRLKDLDIRVELADNGDARITETRRMNIESTSTECYIVVGNMNGSKVRDLSVTDETGLDYEVMDKWQTSWSRSRKTGKCGIVHTDHGYEICWGIGEEGSRTYITSYTVTKLCRSYEGGDGFNYMFVTDGIEPRPEHAKVTIVREGTDGGFNEEDVEMWAFRYHGDVWWIDGAIVAETDEALDDDEAMIVMARIESGVLHPSMEMDMDFDELKDVAFEGSNYSSGFDWSWLWAIAVYLCPFVIWGIVLIRKWRLRRAINKDLLWYRDLPYNGNLKMANRVLNVYKYMKKDHQHLVSAMVLRLISIGALRIENVYVEPGTLKRIVGGKGKNMDCIVIGDLKEPSGKGPTVTKELKMLHEIFSDASGEDKILQPGELKKWMRRNTDRLVDLMKQLEDKMSVKEARKDMDQVRQVMGMKKFLKEFTLANERHVVELPLWKDYLVYAELFGIADQVRRDMKKINPEYLKMEEVYRALFDEKVVPDLVTTTLYGSRLATRSISRERSGGGGGSASFGGGGGFSGGGHGGGLR